jgi:quinol monooxygenase YgiN
VKSHLERISRRQLVAGAAVLAAAAAMPGASKGTQTMHGLIGKMTAAPGKRDELIGILLDGVSGMPGCLSYVVAKDTTDEDALWITEVWDSKESHAASLSLPSVRDAIAKGRPLIAGFGDSVVTAPVGGHGLTTATPR